MTPDDISTLLRLKRHEHPPDGYEDRFLAEFQQRQRAELLKRSSLSLLWERFNTYLGEVSGQKWLYLPASAAVVALALFLLNVLADPSVPSIPTMAQVPPVSLDGIYPTPGLSNLWSGRGEERAMRVSFPALQLKQEPFLGESLYRYDLRMISPEADGRPQDSLDGNALLR